MKRICAGFLLFLMILSCQHATRRQAKAASSSHIGETFNVDHIVDTSGKEIAVDFSLSDINIIDIWNNACPPCLEEMRQFPPLIRGKERKVSIFSISLTQFYVWQKTVKEHTGPFAFLGTSLPNWKQYNFMTRDDPKLRNDFSSDRFVELIKKYNITSNPAYLVLNKNGEIIAQPESAVEYLSGLE